jgi:hypothetical protein
MGEASQTFRRTPRSVTGRAHPDAITPELVLVCPLTRQRAIAALPDRPWEMFAATPRARTGVLPAPRAARPAAAGPKTVVSPASLAVVPRAVAIPRLGTSRSVDPPQSSERSQRGTRADMGLRGRASSRLRAAVPAITRRVATGRRFRSAAMALAATAGVLAAIAWASSQTDAPRLAAPTTTPGEQTGVASGTRETVPAGAPKVRTTPKQAGPKTITIPSPSGFVFREGVVEVQSGASEVVVRFFRGCAANSATNASPVRGGRFSSRSRLAGSGVRAQISGRFTGSTTAVLTLALDGPRCPKGKRQRVATLS